MLPPRAFNRRIEGRRRASWSHAVVLGLALSAATQWALTKEEMKNCVWLKPKLVAQIEFTEWTPDGHLRHSKFAGLRDDKAARDVMREIEGSYDSEALPGLGVDQ